MNVGSLLLNVFDFHFLNEEAFLRENKQLSEVYGPCFDTRNKLPTY